MTRLNTNQWLALVLALVAAAYLAMAWQIPTFPLPRPVDSDLFPKVLGVSLLLLAAGSGWLAAGWLANSSGLIISYTVYYMYCAIRTIHVHVATSRTLSDTM